LAGSDAEAAFDGRQGTAGAHLEDGQSGVRISMDGKGRFLDNIFVERLWRSFKYECVSLHAWETGSEAKAGVGRWFEFYNRKRPHSALGGKPPAVVYCQKKDETQPDQQERRVA